MIKRMILRGTCALAFSAVLAGCASSSAVSTAASLYNQLGGMETISKLGGNLLSSSMKDPRLSSLLGKVDPAVAGPKLNNQLCSALGGGCTAPFTEDQVKSAASKLSTDQKSALSENFGSALKSVSDNPAVRDAVTKSLGSKLGGVVGALL